MRFVSSLLLLLAAPLLLPGCTATEKTKNQADPDTQAKDMLSMFAGTSEAEIHEDLLNFVTLLKDDVESTAEQIEQHSTAPAVRKAALLWRMEIVQQSNAAISSKAPLKLLLEAWAFTVRQRLYFENGDGKNLFQDQQNEAVRAARRLEQQVEQIARRHLRPDKWEEASDAIKAYATANPIRGVFVNQSAGEPENADQPRGVLDSIIGQPLRALTKAGGKVLDPTSRLAESVNRFTLMMEDYPSLLRWQAQLLWLTIQDSPPVQSTTDSFEEVSRSSSRLASVAEELPQKVREELEAAITDLAAEQPKLLETIERAESTSQALDSAMSRAEAVSNNLQASLDDLTKAGEAWKHTADAVTSTVDAIGKLKESGDGKAPAEEQDRPFEIQDYTASAKAISEATAEVRSLLADVRTLLTAKEDQAAVRALTGDVLTDSSAEVRSVVDHAAWRIVQLSLLVLALALVYRFVSSRLRGHDKPSA